MDEVSVRSVRVFLLVGKRVRKSETGRGGEQGWQGNEWRKPFSKNDTNKNPC